MRLCRTSVLGWQVHPVYFLLRWSAKDVAVCVLFSLSVSENVYAGVVHCRSACRDITGFLVKLRRGRALQIALYHGEWNLRALHHEGKYFCTCDIGLSVESSLLATFKGHCLQGHPLMNASATGFWFCFCNLRVVPDNNYLWIESAGVNYISW